MQQAASPLRLYFMLPTSYFLLRCMVETQYDAAGCISTASLLYTSLPTSLPTSCFILHTSLLPHW